jgi:Flp pilus assembly protein TadD/peroxiredoxin
MRPDIERSHKLSRRTFLGAFRWSPLLFLPAPLHCAAYPSLAPRLLAERTPPFLFAESRLTPHYPAKSPLEDVLRCVSPGSDEYLTEKYAAEIAQLLHLWTKDLRSSPRSLETLTRSLDPSFKAAPLIPAQERNMRSGNGVEVLRRKFPGVAALGREQFLEQVRTYLAPLVHLETVEFQIFGIEQTANSPLRVRTGIRYDFVGVRQDSRCEERIGCWLAEWIRPDTGDWRVSTWVATEETLSRAEQPTFVDVTAQALGASESYKTQMLRSTDYWRTVLDEASGINVYGNCGVAAGDFDNDGLDDLYVCQPPGLPNRLYRNRGDGTFEDVTDAAGVGVLDSTACAFFADFDNSGVQDLLVVCAGGPLLFRNQRNGKFSHKPEAFRFSKAPAGTFTGAAIADYDRDGRLDIYFCLYTYYVGLDQYRYPVPYFDARNGPPNFLFHNEGNHTFLDRTEAAGLNIDNDRYSFACTWNDYNSDGWPDLHVVNDFGRNNLYRNNGDGTFTAASSEAGVDDVGAGMSACWLDFDNDGNQDLYAAGMWVADGLRLFGQPHFHGKAAEEIRARYRRHMSGNSLYRNQGNGKFQNVAGLAGVQMGRWSWSTDAWDFDHDGYADVYVTNGYISGAGGADVSSFFWRQVVAKSPENSSPSPDYERGWNAINELIRADSTWNGFERNVFFANNRDGTFSEVSGAVGLDFLDDSRAFALADIDHDGRLEIMLKNRTAPQIRVLHNSMKDLGAAIAFRLRGEKSNRDAIGAVVTVEAGGLRQTKVLQAGSGFLSQHTKELFFGLGKAAGPVRGSIRWPGGLTQVFEKLPVNHRVDMREGIDEFLAKPFATLPLSYASQPEPQKAAPLPVSAETWLVQPSHAPDFALLNLTGDTIQLSSFRGHFVLLHFWTTTAPACLAQLRLLESNLARFSAHDLRLLCINVDDPQDARAVRLFTMQQGISAPILLASQEAAGVYNILYRFLFDRRRDLGIPTSFLLQRDGMIVKVFQGPADPAHVLDDIRTMPDTSAGFLEKALPFQGRLYQRDLFQRNNVTYGVALFQRGYFEQAATSFKLAIANKSDDPMAYYNLGTLYLQTKDLNASRQYLAQAVKLRPGYAEAWNNLGMVAAEQGQEDEAIKNFRECLLLKPTYVTALLNLGNLLRRKGAMNEAKELLERALEAAPEDPDTNYSLGMLYARQNQLERASDYLERAVALRPDHVDALNNLGVVLVRQGRYARAREKFEACIRVTPGFDQAYLNLAGLYVTLEEKEKAREVLLALLRQQPEHKLARQALEMLNGTSDTRPFQR